MSFFAVRYQYTGAPEQRDATRPEHRAFLSDLHTQGFVVASGPLPESDPSSALLIVQADSTDDVLQRLADDPFRRDGLIESATVELWNPVIGSLAPR